MIKFRIAIILLGLLPIISQANFLSELEALEANRVNQSNRAADKAPPKNQVKRYFTLSSGKRMDVSDWQIVHFMSSTCSYCQQFNPVLKQVSETTGFPVFTYSFDGKGDIVFPDVFMANSEVVNNFFAELPRATPTDFLINVNTMVTLPLSQGATSADKFLQRLDEVLIYVDTNLTGM
jgi:type-F conjugative transfer system pilin assembly thiol-disulfide isomerase trbB